MSGSFSVWFRVQEWGGGGGSGIFCGQQRKPVAGRRAFVEQAGAGRSSLAFHAAQWLRVRVPTAETLLQTEHRHRLQLFGRCRLNAFHGDFAKPAMQYGCGQGCRKDSALQTSAACKSYAWLTGGKRLAAFTATGPPGQQWSSFWPNLCKCHPNGLPLRSTWWALFN